jgi:hypothetical protein
MSYIAHHVDTVPSANFLWFLIFLESPIPDDVSKQIDSYFLTLGREVGRDVLVVRGFDPSDFSQSVFEANAFGDVTWNKRARFPSLVVTNRAPSKAVNYTNVLEKGIVMIFPLAEIVRQDKSLSGFLNDLVEALKNEDAIPALESLDGTKIEKAWGWLSKYVKMEPGFYGFKVDLNDAIKKLLAH